MIKPVVHSARWRPLLLAVLAAAAIYGMMGKHNDACATGTTTTTTTTTGTQPTTTGTQSACDWNAFMNAVSTRESSNNPQIRNSLGYSGLFQFGEAALKQIGWYCSAPVGSRSYQAFSGQWCQKAKDQGVTNINDFLQRPEAQKAAFAEWMKYMYTATKKCHSKIGTQAGSCGVTLSGILGGGHLGGQGGVCSYLNGGANASDGKTRIGDYVCCFKGYSICDTVAPGDASCNNGGGDGSCGDTSQANCKGGASSNNTGAGSQNPEYLVGAPTSGLDLPWGPDIHHLTLLSETLKTIWVASLQLMTSQLTAAMVHQVNIIGTFLDAKHQLEIQRLLQQKQADAHKDYHPSEQMCEIGTVIRNLANTEKHMELSHQTIVRRILKRELVGGDATTDQGPESDQFSRMKHLRDVYCNVEDNGNTADYVCKNKDSQGTRTNRDVDYTTTLETPLTLKLDFNDSTMSEDEENLLELVNNLFYHRPFPEISEAYTTLKRMTEPMMAKRSIIAMRGIARHSIGAIIAQKTEGPKHEGSATPYMYALVKEFGLEEEEIRKMIGEHPSYYAQMEILTKKLYQHPSFVVNLYDKPVNVTRIRTAMQAIKTMQDRDIHEAMMRREMLLSMILELRIRQNQDAVVTNIRNNLYRSTPGPQ